MLFQSKNLHFLNSRIAIALAAVFLALSARSGFAQAGDNEDLAPKKENPEISMMEIVNGSSIPAISLMIEGMGEHETVPQGARISGGAFPITKWTLRARPRGMDNKDLVAEESFDAAAGSSSTAVIIGDFVLEKKDEDTKPKLRASILYLSNEFIGNKKPNRLTIVNGMPDNRIEVIGDEFGSKLIEAMNLFEWNSLPLAIQPTVKIDEASLILPIEYLPSISSVVIVIYLQDGKPNFVAAPQSTLKGRASDD